MVVFSYAEQSLYQQLKPSYLSTHCEHNLAIRSSPAPLCCPCDNVSAPVTLPGQAPELKVSSTNLDWRVFFFACFVLFLFIF